jgi:hypothetical protein
VLTAAHCLAIPSPEVLMPNPAPVAPTALPIIESRVDADRTVALLHVRSSRAAGDPALAPIAIGETADVKLAPGDVVEIAGYGRTETGEARSRRFLTEQVARADDKTLTLDGFARNGACEGDSGGPLLFRGTEGAVQIAGVLWLGSANCVGRDTYARVGPVRDWVLGVIGSPGADERPCGTISEEGRCFSGNALWCEAGRLESRTCAGRERCGFEPAAQGFRCVNASSDPCRGVDGVGECQDGAALRCAAGLLQRAPCGCGSTCRVDGRTGSPVCALPEP